MFATAGGDGLRKQFCFHGIYGYVVEASEFAGISIAWTEPLDFCGLGCLVIVYCLSDFWELV